MVDCRGVDITGEALTRPIKCGWLSIHLAVLWCLQRLPRLFDGRCSDNEAIEHRLQKGK